jgi:metallophosphoesterase superfamily enzyme
VRWHAEGLREGPFEWRHAAGNATDPVVHQVCGHVHPALRLREGPRSLRLTVFALEPRRLTLPAFGAFTGGATLEIEDSTRFFAVVEGSVVDLGGAAIHRAAGQRSVRRHRHKP